MSANQKRGFATKADNLYSIHVVVLSDMLRLRNYSAIIGPQYLHLCCVHVGVLSDMLRLRNYTAIIGPQCSGVCRVVARLAAYYNIPVFSGVCQDTEMLNKHEFKVT